MESYSRGVIASPETSDADKWTVEFNVDRRGHSPVAAFIEQVPNRQQAIIAHYLKLLQEFGPDLAMPQARHIEGKLWELRPNAYRLVYVLPDGQRCVLLHAYRNQSQETARKEIDRALMRMRGLMRHDWED